MKYEEAIAKLEEITQKLSNDNVSLDDAVKLFEESTKLSKICFDTIKEVEGKVSVIKKELDGIKEKPLDE